MFYVIYLCFLYCYFLLFDRIVSMSGLLKVRKGTQILLIGFTAVLVAVIGITVDRSFQQKKTTSIAQAAPIMTSSTAVISLLPGINKPSVTTRYYIQENETALSLLQRTQSITVKQYSYGILVESINGYTNGTDGMYWKYLVNGKEATVGAGDYHIVPNDILVWKFEKQ